MQEWTLKSGSPESLTLAADARSGAVDYTDDHIWELAVGRSEPPAIVLQTTFGARARSFRIFPRFGEGEFLNSDPARFAEPAVTVQRYFPSYARLAFSPLPELEVQAEYWAVSSHSICGRFTLKNLSTNPRQVRLELVGVLNPSAEGTRLVLEEEQAALILSGKTENLEPVIFLRGGSQPASGPFPCLTALIDLPPRGKGVLVWGEAALQDRQASFDLARQSLRKNWEAEIARLELLDDGLVQVITGDPAWDQAFSLAQLHAFSLLSGPTMPLPEASFVLARQPDHGYSRRGDGKDYSHLWNGQTPLDALYLSGMLLPAAPGLARGLLRNFLLSQAENGEVDQRPGLGGQRSQLQAAPLLASLAWRIYQATEDLSLLEETYPRLVSFFKAWFTPTQDRDRDGIPEWEHLFQTGLDEHPLFARASDGWQGLEPAVVESPDLCAFLFREAQILLKMAKLLHLKEDLATLRQAAKRLKAAVESTWSDADACYHYRDRDTHETTFYEILGRRSGSGDLLLHKEFSIPERLGIHLHATDESTRRLLVFLHGSSPSGAHRIERISTDRFAWANGWGSATSERTYLTLEHVEVQGLKEGDVLTIFSAGLAGCDLTNLLPLWGGIPEPKRAEALVRQTLLDPERFWKPFGLPVTASLPTDAPGEHPIALPASLAVHLPLNELTGEGLLAYGFRQETAELVQNLMKAVTQARQQKGAFFSVYHAESGLSSGERNALPGLAPLRLFLETLGVRIASPKRVFIEGFNPYPFAVTVKYRGMTILRQKEKTTVVFPDGQTLTTDKTSPSIITLE